MAFSDRAGEATARGLTKQAGRKERRESSC